MTHQPSSDILVSIYANFNNRTLLNESLSSSRGINRNSINNNNNQAHKTQELYENHHNNCGAKVKKYNLALKDYINFPYYCWLKLAQRD